MKNKILDITKLSSQELNELQKSVYQLYKSIYKGPLYENSHFCDKKMIDPSAEVFIVNLCYNEGQQLVGADILKIIPIQYQLKRIGILQITLGYLPNYRSSNMWQKLMGLEILKYSSKHPDTQLYYFDLLTSPTSYSAIVNYIPSTCPTYNKKMNKETKELASFLVSKFSPYKPIPSSCDSLGYQYLGQGAKIRESPEQFFTRLVGGENGSAHVQYLYQLTKRVNGRGVMVLSKIDISSFFETWKSVSSNQNRPKQNFSIPKDSENTSFSHLVRLRRDPLYNLKGTTLHSMLPQKVSIELTSDDQQYLLSKLTDQGYHITNEIHFLEKPKEIGYVEFGKMLTAKSMKIQFKHDGYPIFDALVPQNGFNPFVGPIGAKFVEMILHKDINVHGKNVIDLGCGCGNIGIAATLMGAEKVLFSDIESDYLPLIKQNPLIVEEEHEFVCQDVLDVTLRDENNLGSYDLLFMSTPTFSFDPEKSKEGKDGLYSHSTFYNKLVAQSHDVLRAGGELILWSMIYDLDPSNYLNFLSLWGDEFDLNEFEILSVDSQVNMGIFRSDEVGVDNFYLMYKIRKTSTFVQKGDFLSKIRTQYLILAEYLETKGFFGKAKQFRDASHDIFQEDLYKIIIPTTSVHISPKL